LIQIFPVVLLQSDSPPGKISVPGISIKIL
jgi:hypothetical protein